MLILARFLSEAGRIISNFHHAAVKYSLPEMNCLRIFIRNGLKANQFILLTIKE